MCARRGGRRAKAPRRRPGKLPARAAGGQDPETPLPSGVSLRRVALSTKRFKYHLMQNFKMRYSVRVRVKPVRYRSSREAETGSGFMRAQQSGFHEVQGRQR